MADNIIETHDVRTKDVAQGVRNLHQFGYTIHDEFITPEMLAALCSRLEEQAAMEREKGVAILSNKGHAGDDRFVGTADETALPAYQKLNFLPNKGKVFRNLVTHPIALAYCERMFDDVPAVLSSQTGMILHMGGEQQVLHIDQQPVPFRTPGPLMINVMTCLSDFTPDMGSTRIVPGSHHFDAPNLADPPEVLLKRYGGEFVAIKAKAGSAVIWESRTWHCQWFSRSPQVRRSIASVYCMHFIRPQDNYPALIHDDVYPTLTSDERRLLAFECGFEAYGRLEPRNAKDPRTNPGVLRPFTPEMRRPK